MDSYDDDMRKMWLGFCIAIGAIILAFGLFISLVVIPSNTARYDRCEAAGGVLVKGGACISKDALR